MKYFGKLFLTITALLISSCGEHQHTFSNEWSYDETNHWHAATCEHKDLKSDEAPHTFSDWTIDVQPTETTSGHKYRDCTVCSYKQEESIDPTQHVHTFSNDWTSDSTHHWHAATCGHDVKDSFEEHSYGNWVIDQEATKTSNGLKHRICSICSYKDEEIIPQLPKELKKLERIYLPYNSIEVLTSYTASLDPVAIPYPCEVNFNYEISDSSVLTINEGVITGIKAGNAIVKVYDDNNNNDILDSDEIFVVVGVSVKESDPNIVLAFEKDEYDISIGESETVKYTLTGAKATGLDYGFYSDNEEVCSFANAKLVGHKEGEANISVSWQGYKATAKVVVSSYIDGKLRASEIETTSDHFVVEKDKNLTITTKLLPLGNIDEVTHFSTSDAEIASVTPTTGVVTGQKAGSVIISIRTTNTNLSKDVYVVVVDPDEEYTDNFYNNYYGDLTWENGADLKQKLHDIISNGYKPLYYKYSSTSNWETNQFADQDLYDYSMVSPVYSSDCISKADTFTKWQREHAFAASLMTGFSTGTATSALGRATDFHNLFAAESGANGSRGNKNFGNVNHAAADFNTKGDACYTRKAFEPNNVDKGRLARAIFYMGVMYNTVENATIKETWNLSGNNATSNSKAQKTLTFSSTEQPIEIVEDIIDYNKVSLNVFMSPESEADVTLVNYYRALAKEKNPSLVDGSEEHRLKAYQLYNDSSMAYAIGNLKNLIEWNTFEVDYMEAQHNESVYSHNSSQGKGTQGNRNPFVDYPQLVDYVYGDLSDQPGSLKNLRPSYLSLKMNEDKVHHYAYDSSKEVTFGVGDTFNPSKYNFKAIKNDLSETTVDYSKFSFESYTFTESDVGKTKEFTVTTDLNSFKVTAVGTLAPSGEGVDSLEECKYHYIPTTGNKDDYVGSGANYVCTFGTEVFDLTLGNPETTFRNVSTGEPKGCTIGYNSDKRAGTIEFVSKTSFNEVDSIYFYAYAGSKLTYSFTIKVGSDIVLSGDIISNTPTYYGGILSAKQSGQVTIYIEGCSNGPLTFCGIGINYN